MRRGALAILAFTLVSCSSRLIPASTPSPPLAPLRLVVTPPVAELVAELSSTYSLRNPGIVFDIIVEAEQAAAAAMRRTPNSYWFTQSVDDLDGYWAAPVGVDAIALIAHPSTGLRSLTVAQVRGLYAGELRRWAELGGADVPVMAFTRERGASIRQALERLVLGSTEVDGGVRLVPNDAAMVFSVERTRGAVGFVPLSALANPALAVALDGVPPTRETVATMEYPLRIMTYVAGMAEPAADDPVGRHFRAFFGWVQGPEGQAIVASHGASLPN